MATVAEIELARKRRARAERLKAKLNAHHAAAPDEFLSSEPSPKRPGGALPRTAGTNVVATTANAPRSCAKHRGSSRIRGLPPEELLRAVRQRHRPPVRIGASEEDVVMDRLMTVLFQIEEAQKRQCRGPGNSLDCQKLRKALRFIYSRGIPLRSGQYSNAVLEYARELAKSEPGLDNPGATARSRLRRLTDLRREHGFPEPKRGRKAGIKS
jgi:hypothetical protein